jgi:hypothetical protein
MKKVDKSSSAGTEAELSTNADVSHVSQPIAKPNVVRSCIQENLYTPNCIRTFSGIYMNVFEPTLEMICIEDIAHALSYQCRFGGHLPKFYSVAQHSLNCSYLIEDRELKLAGLLHDASEAYLLDIPRPIKHRLSNYKEIEDKLMRLIAEKYFFEWPLHEDVKRVDELMLQHEWECLMLKKETWIFDAKSQYQCEKDFLSMFKYYSGVFA